MLGRSAQWAVLRAIMVMKRVNDTAEIRCFHKKNDLIFMIAESQRIQVVRRGKLDIEMETIDRYISKKIFTFNCTNYEIIQLQFL